MKEDHQHAITGRDNQIHTFEFTNETHQQQILRFIEEINKLIANRHVARRGCFDNALCFIKKNSGEVHPYYVIRCQYRQLEIHKRWLRFRYPCRWPTNVMIQTPFTKKPNYYKNFRSEHFLKLPWM